jgi:hypothetical protein
MASLRLPLTPPAGVVGCDPILWAADAAHYLVRNRHKLGNYIMASVAPTTRYFEYDVQNIPKDGSGCPGHWLVRLAWEHFQRQGHAIAGIRGDWTFGDNLMRVNHLTAGSRHTLEEAALQTWAADRAREFGMPTVAVLAFAGSPGRYQSVDVLFTP